MMRMVAVVCLMLIFEPVAAEVRAAGPKDWEALDWWLHPGWRAFRDAMSRVRCRRNASR